MTATKTTRPFATWPSVISAQRLTGAAPSLNFIQSQGDCLYWVESRPWEAGRNVIMCRHNNGRISDLLPAPYSHHSKVHEYGGRAYAIGNNQLYFVNAADQCLYQLALSGDRQPRAITSSGPRFADLIMDQHNQRLIAVCEEHFDDREPENYLAGISLDAKNTEIQRLASGADFYAYPRISPDGRKICWIQWQHPNMPWDNSQLWLASLDSGLLCDKQLLGGGGDPEAIFQPHWSPDNQLYFVSDRHDWWNMYCADRGIILAMPAEFATPLWQFGMATYDFIDADSLGCLWTQQGIWHCGFVETQSGQLTSVCSPYSSMQSACCHQDNLYFVASAPALAPQIVRVNKQGEVESVYAPSSLDIATDDLAQPESIQFATAQGETVQAFFYPPTSALYQGEANELPPVIALCHGGPTGATDSGLNLKIQYWTNRGFAVVDINYRGSTGFGRPYRESLAGAWGIADVADTQHAIAYLAQRRKIDAQRCIIRGGSAGGYTVLSALTFTNTFQAGASLYGIGDLETLARDTHKFESHYLQGLIGPYPQRRDLYIERSPIYHAEALNCPVIFLQGLEDKVVPPDQAERMVQILQQKGIKVAHITFVDEGHGFRKADTIIRSLEAEYSFYCEVFQLSEPG